MRHERALEKLDGLDAGKEPGLALRLHLAACPDCAAATRRLRSAMEAYRGDGPGQEPSRAELLLEERVMATIQLTPPPRQDFAIGDWLFPAALILASICLLPVVRSLGLFEAILGEGYALSLVLGLVFTGYSVFFIATHMREVEGFLSKLGVNLR
jgi:hypothetical protein